VVAKSKIVVFVLRLKSCFSVLVSHSSFLFGVYQFLTDLVVVYLSLVFYLKLAC